MSIIDYIKSKMCRVPVYLNHYLSNEIVINGYFFYNLDGSLKNNNFGDDINFPLIQALTGRQVKQEWRVGFTGLKNIVCIGSVIDCCNDKSIVWGTGAISESTVMMYKPKKVLAVRGPLTRKKLLEYGIECPEIYGDPALLIPLVYTPQKEKKYKYGFIPHYIDYNLPHVVKFREEHPEILFIKFEGYTSWQDVIEQINSCDAIVSSSLHGLIVSDAYNIPNVRIVLSDNITGGNFKYRDYMAGVGREYRNPIDGRNCILLDEIKTELAYYKSIDYNPKNLLNTFPYKLKKQYRNIQSL